jgi:uncharacterized protein (TIGR03032 family)
VLNPANTVRIHLVIDTVGSAGLWNLVEHPDRDPVLLDPAGPVSGVLTEVLNGAPVMTPWEIEVTLGQLATDLRARDPDLAARFLDATAPFRRAWREAWAHFGHLADGRVKYRELCRWLEQVVDTEFGGVALPNRVALVTAVRQHVVQVALRSDADVFGSAAPMLSPTPAPTVIDRPVFVVSSPRSGSTLLFETLARASALSTIGGESHRLIEEISGFAPDAHGWDSNRLTAADATPESVVALHRGFLSELRDPRGNPPAGGPVRMLEKTPKNSLRIPLLTAAFPDARFVYLYRDPRETISSMLDAWKSGRFVTYPRLPDWNGPPWSLLLVPGWRELAGAALGEIVARQWAIATTILLDDLEQLDPEQWCVTSYDRLLADPESEMARLCEFCGVEWDAELPAALPLSRHTLDSPAPEKWRRNAAELDAHWEPVAEVALRAHDFFATPPRIKPTRPSSRADQARPPALTLTPPHAAVPAATPTDASSFSSVFSSSFPELMHALGSSLCVSTYQSGRAIVVRADGPRTLNTHFRVFQTPMGVAVRPGELALGTKTEIIRFQNQQALSARLEPPDRHDAVYVPRRTHTTGDIRIHDLGFAGDELWAVNTRFSCLATFDDTSSFVPRWRPPFVHALAAEDRCHLNGMAVVDDEIRFVTALGTSDEAGGWREHKVDGGVLVHVPSGDVVLTGLCMPHSPRWHDGRLWVLESGLGAICVVDPERGTREEVTRVPGFTRGLAFAGPYAFVGLSQVRESLFEGIPLKADGVERSCGVWVVDLRSGQTVAFLRFEGIVQEVYEVALLAGQRWPEIVELGAEIIETAYVLPDAALAEVPGARRS